ncbi:MAG: biosynthetic peptidoglycan transglycosylase [Peptococcaceae bacterium]|nr:biosynthetic peptidoglycan transglycosylase [Peptococcaceae bacterium]
MLHFFTRLIRRLLALIVTLALVAGLVTFAVCGVSGYAAYHQATKDRPLATAVAEVQQKPSYTPLEQIPQIYQDAVVATEDHRFYDHHGFDVIGTTRALLHNALAGELREGGSTITQQLARNLYFTQEQSLSRKIAELITAIQLERHYSKSDILALYINTIYYGDGYYSLAEASWGYFGVAPVNLTNGQATLLAGVPNAPSAYAPTVNYDLARQRQQQVLAAMVNEGYLDETTATTIYNEG